ncbi:MAG: type II secretion system secretin GspD [Pseudomonadales bacterium]|jgi:general secretion pathway protein D|nr:type II secretion system secretin GspD [Pseudomonadales bacterium]MDP6471692.1 type II secretion system secretin GspD [Pseudomonadales bacterium]MDP6972206.1 type II secretion system secretin GspD [Pseudomonadales bacterium]|tara:strand:- start:107 stop:2023 length:1917 start_codon:yes stop_codon:yes gene_type:complete
MQVVRKWIVVAVLAVSAATTLIAPHAFAQEQTWKINIKNADIHEFVAQVAAITGRTFVVDPRLKGNVTVISSESMNAQAIYALFLSVLRAHNFTAVPSGDVVRIQQTATGKQTPGVEGELGMIAAEELVTRVIAAQNVESAELVKILRPLIPQYGHIAAVAEPNIVIISDHADNIRRLRTIIEQIDVADESEVVVVPLEDAWVGNVVAMLEKVAPEQIGRNSKGPQRIQIIANERNNSLVLRGKPKPIAEVLKLIEQLDQPTTTTGAVQVIYLKYADATAIAEILSGMISERGMSNEEGTVEATTIRADESLNAIVVRADPGTMAELMQILDALDVRRTQVLIEAAVVEVSITDTEAIGIEMAAVDTRGQTVPLVTTSLNGVLNSLLSGLIPDAGATIDENVLTGLSSISQPTIAAAKLDADGISFGALVTALATNSHANLLSTPSILTLDNQEAKIVVGQEVPFRTGSFTTTGDGTSNPFTTVQREDVGLQLTVTPHVHDGTSVRLEVAQNITNIVETAVGDSAFADVVTSKREIETTVLAEDRQIIVLGGLIRDDISESRRKVPLLGDIPVLGALFRSTSETRTKNNLLIFLRPTVIKNQEDNNRVTHRKYQDIWEVEITSEQMNDELDELFRGKR